MYRPFSMARSRGTEYLRMSRWISYPLYLTAAARWKAKLVEVPRAGHPIILDAHWEQAAGEIARPLGDQ
jgi:hypothetical protein